MTPLLEARNVTKVFGSGLISRKQTVALEDFSLAVNIERPAITSIVGESGSGKTTMARLLLGLEAPTSGEVLYKGKELRRLKRSEWLQFRKDVQAVFQDPFEVYNPFYKVDHVLEVPIAKFGLANSNRQARMLMDQALEAVGLRPAETLGRFPHELSGGQRQRVMVARALLLKPRLIIADEPVSMIDASLRATVLDNLRKLNEEFGISLIYITHDLTTAYQLCESIIVLYRGSIAEAGEVGLVVKSPLHPYTQSLIRSIPRPDPNQQWSDEAPPSEIGKRATDELGCKFTRRCPHAFEQCLENAPPLYQTDARRAAACYLYQEKAAIGAGDMATVFLRKEDLLIREEVMEIR